MAIAHERRQIRVNGAGSVRQAPARTSDYLEIAARVRPVAESIDGFISVERFESLVQPGKILSLSQCRDEKAVRDRRKVAEHRDAQRGGSRRHLRGLPTPNRYGRARLRHA